MRRLATTLAVAAVVAITLPTASSTTHEGPRRLAGASRFGTAVAVSRAGWPDGAGRAYLASGRTFPDALAATSITGEAPGPVLLTDPCWLPEEVAQELARLGPSEVVAVGGEAAVCNEVLTAAALRAGGIPRRLAGTDRYGTAAAIALEAGDGEAVYLASGQVFADSLAAGPAAAADRSPLLLTATCALPGPTELVLRQRQPKTVVLVGGTAAICGAVEESVRAAVPTAQVERIAGANRFETAAMLAERTGGDDGGTYVASGRTFPDALSAGPLAVSTRRPMLLTEPCTIPEPVEAVLARSNVSRNTVVGGTSAVCSSTAARVTGRQLLFQNDYASRGATDTLTPTWQAEQEPAPDRMRLVTDVPGDGRKPAGPVLRVELRRFESSEGRRDGDVVTTGGYSANRAEVYDRHARRETPPAQWPDPVGSTRWYGFDLFVPADFVEDDTGVVWFSLLQWKGLDSGQPPIALEIKRGHLDLGGASGRHFLGPLKKGQWERVVVGVHFDPGAAGWVEVYRDGVQVLARTSRPTMNRRADGTVDPAYLKLGIYRSTKWQVTHVLYFGPLSIGTSRDDVA